MSASTKTIHFLPSIAELARLCVQPPPANEIAIGNMAAFEAFVLREAAIVRAKAEIPFPTFMGLKIVVDSAIPAHCVQLRNPDGTIVWIYNIGE